MSVGSSENVCDSDSVSLTGARKYTTAWIHCKQLVEGCDWITIINHNAYTFVIIACQEREK